MVVASRVLGLAMHCTQIESLIGRVSRPLQDWRNWPCLEGLHLAP